MNLSEVLRSQALIERLVVSLNKSRGGLHDSNSSNAIIDWQSSLNWQSCAAGLAMLAFGYRLMRALRNKLLRTATPRKCNALVRSKRLLASRRADLSLEGGSQNAATEVCPICLEPPRIGVRTGCDHRMCASCLRRYCEIHAADHKRNRPPPCPLCRTPLVAVTLMYSQINNDAVDTEAAAWIDKFNASRGRPANKTGFLANNALIKLLVAALLFCSVARLQEFTGFDVAAYGSFFVVAALGVTLALLSCLWLGCHGEAVLDDEY